MDILQKKIPSDVIVYTLQFLTAEEIALFLRATKLNAVLNNKCLQTLLRNYYTKHISFTFINTKKLFPASAFMSVYLPRHQMRYMRVVHVEAQNARIHVHVVF